MTKSLDRTTGKRSSTSHPYNTIQKERKWLRIDLIDVVLIIVAVIILVIVGIGTIYVFTGYN